MDLIPKGYWMISNTRKVPENWKIREDMTKKAEEWWNEVMTRGETMSPHDFNGCSIYYSDNPEGIFIMEKV